LAGLLTQQDIFYLPTKKHAVKSVLLNQRQRQGLRQGLRCVNRTSAARQLGRRWWILTTIYDWNFHKPGAENKPQKGTIFPSTQKEILSVKLTVYKFSN
jgi:hypothetical protein